MMGTARVALDDAGYPQSTVIHDDELIRSLFARIARSPTDKVTVIVIGHENRQSAASGLMSLISPSPIL